MVGSNRDTVLLLVGIVMLFYAMRTQLKAPKDPTCGISCLPLCLYGIRELIKIKICYPEWTSLFLLTAMCRAVLS